MKTPVEAIKIHALGNFQISEQKSLWLWMTFLVIECSSFYPVTSCSISMTSKSFPPVHRPEYRCLSHAHVFLKASYLLVTPLPTLNIFSQLPFWRVLPPSHTCQKILSGSSPVSSLPLSIRGWMTLGPTWRSSSIYTSENNIMEAKCCLTGLGLVFSVILHGLSSFGVLLSVTWGAFVGSDQVTDGLSQWQDGFSSNVDNNKKGLWNPNGPFPIQVICD